MTAQVEQTEDLLTIDELAAAVGMTVRTTRYYASLGLLPPPIRRGRLGYYGPQHRARLELVKELQQHGFTLSAIERYLRQIPMDASLAEIAFHRVMLAPWVAEAHDELDYKGVESQAGRKLSDDDMDALIAVGAVQRTGRGKYRPTAALDVGVQLLDMPIPRAAMVSAGEAIEKHMSALAEELTSVLHDEVVQPYRQEHGDKAGPELHTTVEQLRPLTLQAIVTGFQHAANEIIRKSLAE